MIIRISKMISLFIMTVLCCGALFNFTVNSMAFAENRAIITLSSKKAAAGETIDISVNITNNIGISNMLLNLTYDNTIMNLTNVRQGQALSSLNYLTSDHSTQEGYSITPFRLMWEGLTNDSSYGTLVILTFKLKDDAPKGVYNVGLTYSNGDITYFDGNNLIDSDVSINSGIITLADFSEEDPIDNNANTALIIRGAIGGVCGLGVIIFFVIRSIRLKKIA